MPRDRHHDNRDNDLLLVGISCAPAVAGMLATMPLWLFRHLHNRVIHMLALLILFVTLVGCLLIVIARENSGIGFAAIAVSCINFLLFRHYERLLYTLRCPGCRHATLRIRSVHNRTYRLYCKRCGFGGNSPRSDGRHDRPHPPRVLAEEVPIHPCTRA